MKKKTTRKKTNKTKITSFYRRGQKKDVTLGNKKRLGWVFGIVIILFIILVFKVAYLQIVKASELNALAVTIQKQDTEIEPKRGNIYDTNGKALAISVDSYELYVYSNTLYKDKTDDEKAQIVTKLAEVTGIDEENIKSKLSGTDNLVKLASDLELASVQKASDEYGENVVVKTCSSRSYPNGDFASHVLGGVNSENSGRTGLEYEYNSYLAGVTGRVVSITDSQGNTLANGSSKYYAAEDGDNITTTIDEVIQHYVEDAIDQGMEDTDAESITCIVMDPNTGDVLAMANTPSYDPNESYQPSSESALAAFNEMSDSDKTEYLSKMWTNGAVSDIYEPGSTFKLVTSSSAIDAGTTTDSSRYYCPGYILVDGVRLNCWSAAGHGEEDIKTAVANSCNPALATVAMDMGKDTFYHYIDLYGFNDKTGIDLPGETGSIIKDKDSLNNVGLATMGYGQGIAITPIQLLSAVNAMGNGGVLMQPKIVKEIESQDGKTIKTFEDKEVRQVISEDTADEMREIMQYYIDEGGGTIAYIPGYRVGGKTGTAYIPENGGYSTDTAANFVAMAPMDDPQVSILVIVKRSKKATSGATAAGPIVKSILEKTLTYMNVEPEYTDEEKSVLNKTEVTVPDVIGKSSTEASSAIVHLGLESKVTPETDDDQAFNVVGQYPAAGTKLNKGDKVYIYRE